MARMGLSALMQWERRAARLGLAEALGVGRVGAVGV